MGEGYKLDENLMVGEQTFLLPMPPSVNALTFNIPGKGRGKTEVYKAWILEAGLRLNLQRPKRMAGLVRLSIKAIRPNKRRRRDLGNLEKAVSDLLVSHGVIDDDSLIEEINIKWWSSDNMTGISATLTSVVPGEEY
jgi:crossover junction endodeoxyribonuclease RusA